jgi:outer membrane protein, multidrug efflux system
MTVRKLAWGLCLLTLSACAAGPNYKRPEEPLPASYRFQAEAPAARSLADLTWWELYKDPDLATLIRTALEENLDLRIAVARVEEARARAGVARADFYPTVYANLATAPRAESSQFTNGQDGQPVWTTKDSGSTYLGGAFLNWEIDFFGRVRRSTQAAVADLVSTEQGRRAAVTSLVAQVATDYFTLRSLDEQHDITVRTIKSNQDALDLVRERMKGGIASGSEEAQALGQLAAVKTQLPDIDRQAAQRENELSVLLANAPGPIARARDGALLAFPPEVPAGLPATLLERRPDILQAEQRLVAATARIGVAKASAFPFPRILLTAFLGGISTSLSDLLKGDTGGIFSWGPSVNWPLLDLKGKANVDVARAQTEQAVLAYRGTILVALREVADALVALEAARGQLGDAETRVTAGGEYLRLTTLRYTGGVASYLEVLDAQRQLYSAEIDYSRVRASGLLAEVQLYRALGGGWTDAKPPTT